VEVLTGVLMEKALVEASIETRLKINMEKL
jgi:hypothetical protein